MGPRAAATDRGLRLAGRGPHAHSPRRPQAGTTQAGGTEAGRADSRRRPAAQRLDAATRRHWEGGLAETDEAGSRRPATRKIVGLARRAAELRSVVLSGGTNQVRAMAGPVQQGHLCGNQTV